MCVDTSNRYGYRIRLQDSWRRTKLHGALRQQLKLPQRFLNPKREYVVSRTLEKPTTNSKSVRQFAGYRRDQAHHQGRRNHEGRRHEMASEEQGWTTGTRNSTWERAHFVRGRKSETL